MARDIDVLQYLPAFLRDIEEFKQIAGTSNPELVTLFDVLGRVLANQFLEDSDEWGVGKWETVMSLTPFGSDSLETRKMRIQARLLSQTPYTMTTIERQLAALCGPSGYTFSRNVGAKTLSVKVNLGVKAQFDEVVALLDRQVPCDMIIDVTLLYNTHEVLATRTHAQLAEFTHQQLREEVI